MRSNLLSATSENASKGDSQPSRGSFTETKKFGNMEKWLLKIGGHLQEV